MAYFIRKNENEFTATGAAGGAWNTEEQHIAPMMGLMTHLTELDHARRDVEGAMLPGRINVEILGTLSFDAFHIETEVVRPGRTIELVEAVCIQNGRPAVRMRTWFMSAADTASIAGTAFASIPGPNEEALPALGTDWGGGYVQSITGFRQQSEPGRGIAWWRTDTPLIEGETVSNLAYFMSLLDMANGVVVRENPRKVAYPNLDLTAHFFQLPDGPWLGTDTHVSFGASGIGETHSVIHDASGPIGTCSQILTIRRRG
ncbi:MAG: thioesterase family protein [Corynebacterium casei]|uniref:thioesterase family protein n=1 Tax=Corynebacterium casei TaxID=160386 RepID=UPI002647741E|nr:thioesterase family protein [Corynebacterium casei]MDN5903593.1 thioesterase family protein [Corynebacterium casei]MDN6417278.1 thioesterase family protein [Corynebacterium casei]MDN6629389.1 thioesterase family protein [Corynebacterium casei]MDN6674702.1 thioesterase family protein [Corynebacterium casei]MDN6694793.1 thioesterase family protein [Corynebacterium casei]